MTSINDIRERLSEIRPAGQTQDIVALGLVAQLSFVDGRVTMHVRPPAMHPQLVQGLVAEIRRAVGALEGVSHVDVHIPSAQQHGQSPYGELGPLPGVSDILAVASAKGGVGKSTVAVNLACALQQQGQRVGLLDADVYGPSLPTMVGVSERPQVTDKSRVHPLEKYGLKLMSMGFFLDDQSPVIWRGPLVTGLVRQFLKDVEWGELDVLVIDLPPGTGDAQLTLTQQVPISGGVIVTTPQTVSTLDVERGVAMFNQVNTPVLGIVENMSYYLCPHCGTREEIFGSGGGVRLSRESGVPLLGQIPLLPELRASGDAGVPLVVAQPEHAVSRIFRELAVAVRDGMAVERAQVAAPRIIG
jgi:ATP-binding protein involved in chromosome partitioning